VFRKSQIHSSGWYLEVATSDEAPLSWGKPAYRFAQLPQAPQFICKQQMNLAKPCGMRVSQDLQALA
jgi:hypothetical protein